MTEKTGFSGETKGSGDNGVGASVIDMVWDFFKSTKLAIIILIFISATAIIGTVIPQNPNEQQLILYSEGARKTLDALGLFDMYHSKWFMSALALLCINLLVCSLDRLPRALKQMRDEKAAPSSGDPERMKFSAGFNIKTDPKTAAEQVRAFLKKTGGRLLEEQRGDNRFFLLNRGRHSRLGVYILHLSVIMVVLGSLAGNIFGYHGRLIVREGEATDQFYRQSGNAGMTPMPLGFTVACKKFSFELQPETGAPGEFASELAIIDGDAQFVQSASQQYFTGGDKPTGAQAGRFYGITTLMVNHPYYYKNIGLFQSSYELDGVQSVTISVYNPDGGGELGKVVVPADGRFVEAPGGGRMRLTQAYPDNRTQTIATAQLELDTGDAGMFAIEVHKGHSRAVASGVVTIEIIAAKLESGEEVARLKIPEGQEASLPDGGKVKILDYNPSFEMKPHGNMGKMATLEYTTGDNSQRRALFSKFPDFDKEKASTGIYFMVGDVTTKGGGEEPTSNLEYSLAGADGLYATILDVNYDPGVWIVWAGCVFMGVGLWMAFFWSHRKMWVKVAPGRISIGGVANRNLQAFETQFPKTAQKLKETLS